MSGKVHGKWAGQGQVNHAFCGIRTDNLVDLREYNSIEIIHVTCRRCQIALETGVQKGLFSPFNFGRSNWPAIVEGFLSMTRKYWHRLS